MGYLTHADFNPGMQLTFCRWLNIDESASDATEQLDAAISEYEAGALGYIKIFIKPELIETDSLKELLKWHVHYSIGAGAEDEELVADKLTVVNNMIKALREVQLNAQLNTNVDEDTESGIFIAASEELEADAENGGFVFGQDGKNGREVTLGIVNGYIAWKYTDEITYYNLVSLASLKGEKGDEGVPGALALNDDLIGIGHTWSSFKLDSLFTSMSQQIIDTVKSEADLRELADTELNTRLDDIQNELDAEELTRQTADANLGDRITDVTQDLALETQTREQQLSEKDTEISTINAALQTEKTERETDVANLQQQITDSLSTESTARQGADQTLQQNINTVADSLSTESTARQNADTVLQQNINTLGSNLTAESTARQSADTVLQQNINTVAESISTEITARQGADQTLQQNINTVVAGLESEETARQSADTVLQQNIDTVGSNLSAETIARQNADTNLENTKEPNIQVSTTDKYYRGDKTWQTLENDVRATKMTGLSLVTNAVITAVDSVLVGLGKLQAQITGNKTTADTHISRTDNPHSTTKSQVGLGNVDNTSDVNKPISAATQNALDLKATKGTDSNFTAKQTFSAGVKTDTIEASSDTKVTVNNSLHVNGDITLTGAIDVVFATITEIKDKIFRTNKEGTDATSEGAGMEVYRPSGNVGVFWSNVNSWWNTVGGGINIPAGKKYKINGVDLAPSDIGLGNVDNTTDASKNVLSATKFTTPRKINGVNFDGTVDITVVDATKEPVISGAGTTAQFFRGDKTWQDFMSAARATTMSGIVFTANSPVVAADSLLVSMGKLQAQISGHTGDTNNPHSTTKSQVGLGNVDNTSDANKPISLATQTALNLKANDNSVIHNTGNESNITGNKNANGVWSFDTVLVGTTTNDGINKLQINGSVKFSGGVDFVSTKFRRESASIPIGTTQWLRIAIIPKYSGFNIKFIGHISSSNTIESFSIIAKGDYFTLNTRFEVDEVSYNQRLLYVCAKDIDESNLGIYIRVRTNDYAAGVVYSALGLNDFYPKFEIDNTVVDTLDTTGSSICEIANNSKTLKMSLHVEGSTTAKSFESTDGTIKTVLSYSTLGVLGTISNHGLQFVINSIEAARFTTNNNLLIGTTTDDGVNKLQVKGSHLIQSTNSRPQFIIKREEDTRQGLSITAGGGETIFRSFEGTDVVYGSYIFKAVKGSTEVERFSCSSDGKFKINDLIGTGNRVLIADTSGNVNAIDKLKYLFNKVFINTVAGVGSTSEFSQYDIQFSWQSDTQLRITMKGSDNVLRSTILTLS